MTEAESQFPSGRIAIGIVCLSFLLILVVEYVIWKIGMAGRKEVFLAESLIIVPALWYSYRKGYSLTNVFRIRWPGKEVVSASFMIGIGVLVLSDGFDRFTAIFLPGSEALEALQKEMQKSFGAQSGFDLLLIIISVIILAGILEEMLFRGFLMGALEQEFNVTKAVMTTAFIFSFFHYVWLIWPWAFIQFLIIGIIMGVVAWRSDSIVPAAVVHMVNNTAVLIFLQTDDSPILWYEWHGQVAPWILLLAAVMTYYGFKNLYRFTAVPEEDQESDTERYIDIEIK